MRIIFDSIYGTYMRCAKIEARNRILDVRLSKEYWKRFCDNQRHLTSSCGIFPLELNRQGGFHSYAVLLSVGLFALGGSIEDHVAKAIELYLKMDEDETEEGD